MRWAGGPGQPVQPPLRPAAPPPKKGGGCFKIVVALLISSFLFCCCIVSAALESTDDPLNWDQVVKGAPDVGPKSSLGQALVPEDLSPEDARRYAWRKALAAYELKYGVSSDVHEQVETDFTDLSDRFSYRAGKGTSFTWAPPPACRTREWSCVFDSLAADNGKNIKPLTALFKQRQIDEKLDQRDVTELVVSFVQNIKYRLPTEETAAFGLLPPTIVVADGSGDCDSKALLATIILQQLGIDSAVLLASGLGHAALGVAIPGPGRKFGKKYIFVEVTTPGWAIGAVPPGYDIASAWKVIPVTVAR